MMTKRFSDKYKPLFNLLNKDYYPEVDTVIITGGRGSGKSFVVAIISVIALVDHDWNILYTRFTNASIVDSVKPEVDDKIELLGYGEKCESQTNKIVSGSNRISFKGIKTGSKQQTANLKSLSGYNCFVIDEAEETPDYDTFKKVFYSIRSSDKRNLTILILNPTYKQHWIFREFFQNRNIEAGSNCIKDNVMYIHTSYLDVEKKFIAENIRKDYDRLKELNPEKYTNIVMGGWIDDPEGVLLPKSNLKFADLSFLDKLDPKHVLLNFAFLDPADKGGDNFAVPFCKVCYIDNQLQIYVYSAIYSKTGTESTCERITDRAINCKIEQTHIEINGLGLAAYALLKKSLPEKIKLIAYNQRQNKEVRILGNYEFIQQYFTFSNDFLNFDNKELVRFINDLTAYTTEGDNKHIADAIDSLSAVANFVKLKYRKLL